MLLELGDLILAIMSLARRACFRQVRNGGGRGSWAEGLDRREFAASLAQEIPAPLSASEWLKRPHDLRMSHVLNFGVGHGVFKKDVDGARISCSFKD